MPVRRTKMAVPVSVAQEEIMARNMVRLECSSFSCVEDPSGC